MKRREAQSVGDIIEQAITATGNRDTYERQQACFVWSRVVGPTFSGYTTRRWVEGSVMHVCMSSAVMKQELAFRSGDLVAAINAALGHNLITDIIIH